MGEIKSKTQSYIICFFYNTLIIKKTEIKKEGSFLPSFKINSQKKRELNDLFYGISNSKGLSKEPTTLSNPKVTSSEFGVLNSMV